VFEDYFKNLTKQNKTKQALKEFFKIIVQYSVRCVAIGCSYPLWVRNWPIALFPSVQNHEAWEIKFFQELRISPSVS